MLCRKKPIVVRIPSAARARRPFGWMLCEGPLRSIRAFVACFATILGGQKNGRSKACHARTGSRTRERRASTTTVGPSW